MINYQSERPSNNFLMLENSALDELSPMALYLYTCYRRLQPNEDNSNAHLMEVASLKKTRFDAAKAELVKKGYLDTKQLFGNKYALYIGKSSVEKYKYSYKSSDNRHVLHELKNALESQKS